MTSKGFTNTKFGHAALLIAAMTISFVAQHAGAANIVMNASNATSTSGFNSGTGWTGGAPPAGGNSYFTGAFILRTPADATSPSFAGNSLSIDTGGRFLFKNTGTTAVITVNNLVLNGGTADFANTNGDNHVVTLAGGIAVNSASYLGALGAASNSSASFETLNVSASISGSAGLTIAGTTNSGANTGVVKLSAANSYSGTITVATPGNGFVASTTNRLLQLNHLNALQNATLNLGSEANGISFTSAANTGAFNIGALSGASNQLLTDTAGNAVTLNVGGNQASTTYSGILLGSGALTKSGNGILTLSGSNLHSGNTTIQSGTLALSGGGTLSSPNISVSTGATFDVSAQPTPTLAANQCLLGSGTVNGALTVAPTSKIYPATDGTAGTLTFNHGMTMASGASFNMDVSTSGSSGNDTVNVGGALALNNTTFRLHALNGTANLPINADYVLVTAASISGGPNPAVTWVGTPPANATDFRIVATPTQVKLHRGGSPLSAVGSVSPASITGSQPVLLTVTITPGTLPTSTGIAVTADLTPIGGSSSQTLYDDGTHGDAAAGDNTFSFNATPTATPGSKNLIANVTDTENRNASATVLLTILPVISTSYIPASFLPVTETSATGSFPLAAGGQTAPIYYSSGDAAVVGIAANALRDDIQRVTGLLPTVSTGSPAAGNAVFVGTVGSSALIDSLVASGKIDVSAIQGKWEAYTAAVVVNPVAGVSQALIIAGSDRRGTAYGVFGLSEAMGVSPWYWWGDVPAPQKTALYVGGGTRTEPSPGVKYRGIFLNDEDWGLLPWSTKTFEPANGSVGPNTYARVFELLLRLHSNYCWPAMHEATKAFYLFPQNKVVADNYAIVIGTSHHEPMLRNTSEYDPNTLGAYNYWTNRTNVYNFWDQRVAETSGYENIYTVGMRGLTDDGMISPAGTTTVQKKDMLQNSIIPDQRQMIANHVNPNPALVPQVFVPYKEALVQYQAGLQLPDDVTLVWPDDNHGYIRQLSNAAERARGGGSGVYYHLSYWGSPKSFLWLCTTPPAMTCSEMTKAWDYDARKMWLVNIGDIKPGEIGMEFFLRLARNPEAFRNFNQHEYLTQWAARTFGAANAEAIATIMDEYYRLNIVVRPEHLDRTTSGFDFTGNGDEAQQRLDEFAALTASADALYAQLPSELKAAFYETVLYPVRGSNQLNRKILLAERSRLWAAQGRAATSIPATAAQTADTAIQTESTFYNQINVSGKWDRMMTRTTTQEASAPYLMPAVGSYSVPAAAGLGVAVEGSAAVLATGIPGVLPTFNPVANKNYFVDVFNTGSAAMSWTAQSSASWITLSQTGGTADARIAVGIDWTKAPRGHAIPGTVTIQGANTTRTVSIKAFYPLSLDPATLPPAVENNGVVTIEAENFTSKQDAANGTGWRKAERATASRDGMTIQPATAASIDPAAISNNTPSLTYQFYTFSSGATVVQTACLPTHKITSDHAGCRYAISLNGDTPKIVDINADEYSTAWNVNVLRATALGSSNHSIATPGLQTLKVWMIDPGVVLDKLTLTVNSGVYEAENLDSTFTGPYHTFAEATASGGGAVSLDATAIGQSITLALPDVAAGTYDLTTLVKKGPSRGIAQLSVSDTANGTFTNLGGTVDFYNASLVYTDLATVRVTFATSGTKYLRFTVTGKNAAASNYWIVPDRFTLVPVSGTSGPLESWRSSYFGTGDGSGVAADAADPDSDGFSNLLEYATGSYPTASNASIWTSAIASGHLTLTFPRLKDATDITYFVLASNDLAQENEIWSSATVPYPGGSAASFLTTVIDPQTTAAASSRFLRLKVTRP
ncbi:MAG: glycosyl hydrolase 115 family protein [Luteolibacter sp.]